MRPVETGFQRPAVDDVAHQINRVGLMVTQKVEQLSGLTAARAEMDVGDEHRPKPEGLLVGRRAHAHPTWPDMARRVAIRDDGDVTAAGRFFYGARGCDGQLYEQLTITT